MTVNRFFLPKAEAAQLGLCEINMSRLGRFVAIAGKNGAGKSRLLNKVVSVIENRSGALSQLPAWRTNLKSYSSAMTGDPGNPSFSVWRQTCDSIQDQMDQTLERVIADENSLFKVVRFVPKSITLNDPRTASAQALISNYRQAAAAPIENYSVVCLSYIQQLQNRWWNATHQDFLGDQSEQQEIIIGYKKLNDLILALLGVKVTRSLDGESEIFGKPLAESALSHGQIVLLQIATAIHAQGATLNNAVFVLDELENHLHPSATIEILEKLGIAAPNAQIWLATHSIPLLAYILSIEPMALWFMDDGEITHAGRHPERVLESLLGDETRIGQLNAFTGLPSQLATTNYAVESLFPPLTLKAEDGDSQIGQIAQILKDRAKGEVLSILDFGAGKGRLLDGLAAIFIAAAEKLNGQLDYFAYDEFVSDKSICVDVIKDHFDDAEARYFSSLGQFFEAKDEHSIDVVVMCNVLHEIPPKDWLPLFSANSLIMRSLKDDGYLLLVEDQRIPVGEKAHEHGFLVLDTAQLKTLFDCKASDVKTKSFVFDDRRKDGRLKAHLISKSLLKNITHETKTKAIAELQEEALTQIRDVRKKEANYANGQLHGFWTQQLANAYMYLKENQAT